MVDGGGNVEGAHGAGGQAASDVMGRIHVVDEGVHIEAERSIYELYI